MTDMKRLGAVLLLVATGLVAAGPALGQTAAVVEYQRLIAQVCQKKITPEMVRLYEVAEKELDAARARGEQESLAFRADQYYWRDLGRPADLTQAALDLQQNVTL